MKKILKTRQIPTEKILSWFSQSSKKVRQSAWFRILKEQEIIFAYYEMIYLGEGFESKNVKNFETAHPLRTFAIYQHLKRLDKNSALICGEKFFGKELEILTLTTGKLSVAEIAEKTCLPFSEVKKTLDRLEKNFMIVYAFE